jgi:type I restriction enzyme M protein
MNPGAKLIVYGQELNGESYAMCKSDMLIKGQDVANIIHGNTLSSDGLSGKTFDYCLSNPPFGVEWTKVESEVKGEYEKLGFAGRFGPGLPRKNDGSFLFLLHLISKMSPVKYDGTEAVGGGRIAIVLNGSPLFTGSAGSGESDIRKWVLENDLLEAIIALPNDMFYNTGIATYIWVLSNHKPKDRKGKVQLIDGSNLYQKMRKSLGNKRSELGESDIATITQLYGNFTENEHSKIFNTRDFGYSTITVERPLRLVFSITSDKIQALLTNKAAMKLDYLDQWVAAIQGIPTEKQWTNREKFVADIGKALGVKLSASEVKILVGVFGEQNDAADVCLDKKGIAEPDADLRDTENVPLGEDINAYFDREVKPHAPDAWIDHSKTKVGYEIPFTRHFYKYVPPRSLNDIDAELSAVTKSILALLGSVTNGS